MSDCDDNYYCLTNVSGLQKGLPEEVCFSLFEEECISIPSLGILLPLSISESLEGVASRLDPGEVMRGQDISDSAISLHNQNSLIFLRQQDRGWGNVIYE